MTLLCKQSIDLIANWMKRFIDKKAMDIWYDTNHFSSRIIKRSIKYSSSIIIDI